MAAPKGTLGAELRALRDRRGLTQDQAADATGLAQNTISTYENNGIEPHAAQIRKLLDAYNASDDERATIGALVVGLLPDPVAKAS